MYDHYEAQIHTEFSLPAGHGMPVNGNGWGGPCESANPDQHFINECGYSGVYEMFRFLLDDIKEPEIGYVADGHILRFDQSEFSLVGSSNSSLSTDGLLYVPKSCLDKTVQCKLHVAFHGCTSNELYMGTGMITKTQYAEVAELNNIIVIFPQTTNTIFNDKGCWDFIGYTNARTYPTNEGIQTSAVYKMLQRVLGRLEYVVD